MSDAPPSGRPEADRGEVPGDRRAGRWWWIAGAVVVVGLVAAVVTLAVMGRSAHRVETAREAGRTAAEEATAELLSYDHETIEADLEVALDGLTDDFADEYARLITERIVPVAVEDEIDTTARVVAGGVASARPDRVEVLLFVNQETESTQIDEPRVDGSRVLVTARRVEGRWLIDDLEPV